MIDAKLETLIKVSALGNYTKAADELSLTQPAVSQHIKGLENELGIKIFNKTDEGLKPTPEGIIAIKYAKKISALYALEKEEISDSRKGKYTLSIGLTHSAENSPFISAVADLTSAMPSLRIRLSTDTIRNLYGKLDNYEVDVIVVDGPSTNSKYSSLLLDTDSLVVVVSKSSPLANKNVISFDELKKEKLILRTKDSGTRNLFDATLSSHGLNSEDLNVILEVDSVRTIKDLVIKNVGITILSRSACETLERNGIISLLSIEGLPMSRQVNLIYPKDFDHPEILNGIIGSYRKVMRKERGL